MHFRYTFYRTLNSVEGVCKQAALWVHDKDTNTDYPLVYFQKPKWISEVGWCKLLSHLDITLPENFNVDEIRKYK